MYDISGLDAGTLYYVRVFAVSSIGTSDSTVAANNPVAPSQHPDAPADIAAEAVIGSGADLNSGIEVGKLCALYLLQIFGLGAWDILYMISGRAVNGRTAATPIPFPTDLSQWTGLRLDSTHRSTCLSRPVSRS